MDCIIACQTICNECPAQENASPQYPLLSLPKALVACSSHLRSFSTTRRFLFVTARTSAAYCSGSLRGRFPGCPRPLRRADCALPRSLQSLRGSTGSLSYRYNEHPFPSFRFQSRIIGTLFRRSSFYHATSKSLPLWGRWADRRSGRTRSPYVSSRASAEICVVSGSRTSSVFPGTMQAFSGKSTFPTGGRPI